MEYINNSVRKLGNLLSSPPSASVLGKCKARHDEDIETPTKRTSLRFTKEEYAEHPGGSSSTKRLSKTDLGELEDPYAHVTTDDKDEDHNGVGYPISPPPQRPLRRPTALGVMSEPTALAKRADAATQKADSVVRKAREAMQKSITKPTASNVQPHMHDIQYELEQQYQEEADRKALYNHKKRSQRTANPKDHPLTLPRTVEQTPGPSNRKMVSEPPSSKSPVSKTPPTMTKTKPWDSLNSKEKWSTKPNRRAREVLEDNHDPAVLLEDLQEPAYACHDMEIRDGIRKTMSQIEDFANAHFDFEIEDNTLLRPALKSMAKETAKIIACVASGGWEELFLASDKRKALVCAIIGNVLVEQVFQHIFFGGTEAQIKEVAAIQEQHQNDDGFHRTTLYAAKIRSLLTSPSKPKPPTTHPPTLHLPPNFTTHTTHITASLLTHLRPILALHPSAPPLSPLPLHALITHAALLALQMRLSPHTAYHFPPAFKHQPFSPYTMSCLNAQDLPSTPEREHSPSATALVQIALFPGVTAYRKGGWEVCSSASPSLSPQYESGCAGKGVRERWLTRAWVYCGWGRARGVVDGGEGGFVEFWAGVGE